MFGEVVIDAVDLLLVENVENNLVQSLSRSQVASERFLNDDAHPRIRRARAREPRAAEMLNDISINFRRSGEIEEADARNDVCILKRSGHLMLVSRKVVVLIFAR